MKDINWFNERVGRSIIRKKQKNKPIKIIDKQHANYLHLIHQEEGIDYSDEEKPQDLIKNLEDILKPNYMNDVFTWNQIKKAIASMINKFEIQN